MHGTCVAIGGRAVLLRGAPGAGKSDLALRFICRYPSTRAGDGASLVADDQVILERSENEIIARPPETIEGKLEVRGVGLVDVDCVAGMPLRLIVDLVASTDVPRLPPEPLPCEDILGVGIPVGVIAPFENSAVEKLKLLLTGSRR